MSINRETVNELWFICTVAYHAAVKKNKFNLLHEKNPYMYYWVKKARCRQYVQNDSVYILKKKSVFSKHTYINVTTQRKIQFQLMVVTFGERVWNRWIFFPICLFFKNKSTESKCYLCLKKKKKKKIKKIQIFPPPSNLYFKKLKIKKKKFLSLYEVYPYLSLLE